MALNPVIFRDENILRIDRAAQIEEQNNPQTANPAPREPVANPHQVVNRENFRVIGVAPAPISTYDMSVAIQNIEHAERHLLNDGGGTEGSAARVHEAVGVLTQRIVNGDRQNAGWQDRIRAWSQLNRGDQVGRDRYLNQRDQNHGFFGTVEANLHAVLHLVMLNDANNW